MESKMCPEERHPIISPGKLKNPALFVFPSQKIIMLNLSALL
jgi:hypothetical protein